MQHARALLILDLIVWILQVTPDLKSVYFIQMLFRILIILISELPYVLFFSDNFLFISLRIHFLLLCKQSFDLVHTFNIIG